MKTSDSIKAIVPALLNAQRQIIGAKKESENPYFKSKYADLPSVIEACKGALNDNEITVLQPINGSVVETILIHVSGEWISSETNIVCKAPNDPQAYGSAITYARRYGLQSMVLMPAEDDDGEGAMNRNEQKKMEETVARALSKISVAKTIDEIQKIESYAKTLSLSSEQFQKIHEAANSQADKLNAK